MNVATRGPTFFIAGVPKAGTTSLYEYLRQHPEVYLPENKEPTYFVRGWGDWSWEDYLELFANPKPTAKVIGEASAGYLAAEESAEWIKSKLGEVQIILVLRDPAERAFSQYCWMVREGYEYASTFSFALKLEALRLQDERFQKNPRQIFQDYLYYTVGLYYEQVKRYLATFGSNNVRIYLFEDLSNKPLDICVDVFNFLGVDPGFTPKFRVHNEGRFPKWIALQYFLRTHSLYKPTFITTLVGRKRLEWLMTKNVGSQRPNPDEKLLKDLKKRYEPNVRKLQDLLGRDLSNWMPQSEK